MSDLNALVEEAAIIIRNHATRGDKYAPTLNELKPDIRERYLEDARAAMLVALKHVAEWHGERNIGGEYDIEAQVHSASADYFRSLISDLEAING